jgi:hypothetical protein
MLRIMMPVLASYPKLGQFFICLSKAEIPVRIVDP